MSKRFGRNQRRHLRDAMSGMERTNIVITKQLVSCQKELNRVRNEIRDIHAEICRAFNERHPLMKVEAEVSRDYLERGRMQIAEANSPLPFLIDARSANVTPDSMIKQRVVYLLHMEGWPDSYRRGIAFKAFYEGKVVGFFASELDLISRRDAKSYFAEYIAESMEQHLRKL